MWYDFDIRLVKTGQENRLFLNCSKPPRGGYPSNRKKIIMTTKKNIGTEENHEEDHKHHKH
jgi:hypothetical protein